MEIYFRPDERAPSVGFIQFALGSFYADCPHKRIIYNESVHGKEERATCDSVKNVAFIRVFCVESMQSMRVARVFTLG